MTYARRYALFTMVGIAGEDDLDAPPDVTDDAKAVDRGRAASAGPAPARPSQSQTGNGTTPQILAKLSTEESAAIRAELIREIETLPEDDLQSRAIAILKAKNRLSADDAKRVEDAFAVRMVLQEALPKDMTTDGAMSALSDSAEPPPTAASTGPAKPQRQKGRSSKAKAATEQSGAPPAIPKPTDDNLAPASTHIHDDAPGKIDKSVLTISGAPSTSRQSPPQVRCLAALSGLWKKPHRRPPSAVHPAPRDGAQGQRRVHRTAVQNPSP